MCRRFFRSVDESPVLLPPCWDSGDNVARICCLAAAAGEVVYYICSFKFEFSELKCITDPYLPMKHEAAHRVPARTQDRVT